MSRILITVLLIGVMSTCFAGSIFASYAGWGLSEVGRTTLTDPSVRDGSLTGPRIVGGGPSSGK